MEITDISDAKNSLPGLIEKVMKGEEVIIGMDGKPVAKLVPYALDTTPRQLGVGNWKGNIWIADDFDEPSDEIEARFSGEAGKH